MDSLELMYAPESPVEPQKVQHSIHTVLSEAFEDFSLLATEELPFKQHPLGQYQPVNNVLLHAHEKAPCSAQSIALSAHHTCEWIRSQMKSTSVMEVQPVKGNSMHEAPSPFPPDVLQLWLRAFGYFTQLIEMLPELSFFVPRKVGNPNSFEIAEASQLPSYSRSLFGNFLQTLSSKDSYCELYVGFAQTLIGLCVVANLSRTAVRVAISLANFLS